MPVSLVGRSPLVLTVGTSSPLKSLADLTAKAKANPAKLNYPSSALGGPNHMGSELYAMQANVEGDPCALTRAKRAIVWCRWSSSET